MIAGLEIVQNAYVVRDLEGAARRFQAAYGIGPCVGGAELELSRHVYRGSPAAPIRLRGAMVQSGGLNIELVQMVSEGPCAFTEMFARGEEGFHHVAAFTDDYAGTVARFAGLGMAVVSAFELPWGVPVCYIDARPTLGHMIEIYPEDATIRAMYAQVRDAAAAWDGATLMVPWG